MKESLICDGQQNEQSLLTIT